MRLRSDHCQGHEYYKRTAAIMAELAERHPDPAEAAKIRADVTRIRWWADLRAPHSLHTNGYRRKRRKQGRKGWPSRKERHLAKLLTTYTNWQLGKMGMLPEGVTVTVVPK